MKLIIFDIDGTLVDSVKLDDQCFIQTFQDLHNVDLVGTDWNDFTHVTDSGLTTEIFELHLGRQPSKQEPIAFKKYFLKLISQRKQEISEINGATETLNALLERPEYAVALATGGWRETALFKLSAAGFDLEGTVLVTANEHYDRTLITRIAIEESLTKENRNSFDSITYIGDGLWDLRMSQSLRINFIGIDAYGNNKLVNAGAANVIRNLTELTPLIN